MFLQKDIQIQSCGIINIKSNIKSRMNSRMHYYLQKWMSNTRKFKDTAAQNTRQI